MRWIACLSAFGGPRRPPAGVATATASLLITCESGFASSIAPSGEQQHELDRRDCARDDRRAAPGADELVRGEERGVHGASDFRRWRAESCATRGRPGPGARRARRRAASAAREPELGRLRARRRARSGAGRRGAPARTPARRRRPATSAHARWSSSTVVSIPLPTLKTPPSCAGRREQRLDDVADVDEVAGLQAVAEDHRLRRRERIRSRKIDDHAAFEARRLPRPEDVPEPRDDVASCRGSG